MIDVFYCTMPNDPLREAIAKPCLMMWKQIQNATPGSGLVVVRPDEGMSGREFQQIRRKRAENWSRAPFYIVADDDCMPLGKKFLERCEALMHKYPEYAILGTEDYCAPYGPDEIYETTTAGGINVVRKGILEIPAFNGQTWDGSAQGQQIRAKGFKVGRMRDVRRNHYGDGLSTVWPDNYASGKTQIAYLGMGGVMV